MHWPSSWPVKAIAPIRLSVAKGRNSDTMDSYGEKAGPLSAGHGETAASSSMDYGEMAASSSMHLGEMVGTSLMDDPGAVVDTINSALMVFIHRVALEEMQRALTLTCESVPECSSISWHRASLLRFQLRGPTSNSIIHRALEPHSDTSPDLRKAWKALSFLDSPACLLPRTMFGIGLKTATRHMSTVSDSLEEDHSNSVSHLCPSPELSQLLIRWPPSFSNTRLFSETMRNFYAFDMSSALTDAFLRRRFANGKEYFESVLVQEAPACMESKNIRGGFGSGWDIIIPVGVGRSVWCRLVEAGARAIGLCEARNMTLQTEEAYFPSEWPDTEAGVAWQRLKENQRRAAYKRRPQSRRLNYSKLGVKHPFAPNWEATNDAYFSRTAAEEEGGGLRRLCVLRGKLVNAWLSSTLREYLRIPRGNRTMKSQQHSFIETMPPLLRQHAEASLIRVRLFLCNKGRATSNAEIYSPSLSTVAAWRNSPDSYSASTADERATNALIGYVSIGGADLLRGRMSALGFCAASKICDLVGGDGQEKDGSILVLVRNVTSRQLRPALVSLLH